MPTIKVIPNPDCGICRGIGEVTDWVPYGSTNVPMTSLCDCVAEQVDPDFEGVVEVAHPLAGMRRGKPHEHYD